jgi:hypothetical protein
MNTERMGGYLSQVASRIPANSSSWSPTVPTWPRNLAVPENIRLLRLPADAPELNPQEHLWDEVRKKEFPGRVFSDWTRVTGQLEHGLPQLAADRERLRIAAWPWTVCLTLNASQNYPQEWRH